MCRAKLTHEESVKMLHLVKDLDDCTELLSKLHKGSTELPLENRMVMKGFFGDLVTQINQAKSTLLARADAYELEETNIDTSVFGDCRFLLNFISATKAGCESTSGDFGHSNFEGNAAGNF